MGGGTATTDRALLPPADGTSSSEAPKKKPFPSSPSGAGGGRLRGEVGGVFLEWGGGAEGTSPKRESSGGAQLAHTPNPPGPSPWGPQRTMPEVCVWVGTQCQGRQAGLHEATWQLLAWVRVGSGPLQLSSAPSPVLLAGVSSSCFPQAACQRPLATFGVVGGKREDAQ